MQEYDVLILEDDPERMKKLRQFVIGCSHIWCKTSTEAITVLKHHKVKWVMLDHDLADEHYIKDPDEHILTGTGQDTADWIAYNKPDIKGVIIHSLNPVGSLNMKNVLERHGIPTLHKPGIWNTGTIFHYISKEESDE